MQKDGAPHNAISNEEARSYASKIIQGIQHSMFSSMNSNQSIQNDTYSVNYEIWGNYSDRMQQDLLAFNSSLQTRKKYESSCSQNNYFQQQERGYNVTKSHSFSPSTTMYGSYEYNKNHSNNRSNMSIATSHSDTSYENVKPGKKCPSCSEINSPKSNWCMECGKAILSVEVRRYDPAGQPHDSVSHSPSQYSPRSFCQSPPRHCSFDEQYSPDNISTMMNNVNLEGYTVCNQMIHSNQERYYNERVSSISFDFENPQFDDLSNQNDHYPKNHAVYRRASHDDNHKRREDFYPFDDLLYPEFAIYDPNLGNTFPSSIIVSNGVQQLPVFKSEQEMQYLQSSANKKYQNNKRKKKRSRKYHQVCLKNLLFLVRKSHPYHTMLLFFLHFLLLN